MHLNFPMMQLQAKASPWENAFLPLWELHSFSKAKLKISRGEWEERRDSVRTTWGNGQS